MLRHFLALSAILVASSAIARDNIQIVGSSTVFPFAAQVAENFAKTSQFAAPIVEATGSGGGLKLFCSGLGDKYPDISNSSRQIKQSEITLCQKNGVSEIIEVLIGFDGIVLGHSVEVPPVSLTLQQLFASLAAQVPDSDGKLQPNPFTKWNDIDPALPDYEIKIYGPPPTSGTRDAFLELAMEIGASSYPSLKALKESDKKQFKAIAHSLREDGVFIEAGENDNLIINKLGSDPQAFGIFGYSFLEENDDKVAAVSINGISPEFEAIADGDYGLARALYFYVKKQHIGSVAGIAEYLEEFTSEKAWGEDGYLVDKGLIPLDDETRQITAQSVKNLETLQ